MESIQCSGRPEGSRYELVNKKKSKKCNQLNYPKYLTIHMIPHKYFDDLILLLDNVVRKSMGINLILADESDESLMGDTEDEGIENDAEEDELEADDDEADHHGVVDGEPGRRKPDTGSRLTKSGVARQLVTHCRF